MNIHKKFEVADIIFTIVNLTLNMVCTSKATRYLLREKTNLHIFLKKSHNDALQ